MNTLLLTWTIAPNSWISQIWYKSSSLDPQKRLKEYVQTLIFYITESEFDAFVFCENSNYPFPEEKKLLIELANYYEKKIEFLQFEGNHQKTLEKGYGYWEGECIDYAFDHSELLQKTNSWYKITGRYIYENMNELLESSIDEDNLFFRWMWPLAYFCVATAFFKVSNTVYKKYLYNCKEELSLDSTIEAKYYSKLRNAKIDFGKLKVIPFRRESATTLATSRYHHLLLWLGGWNMGTQIGKILDKLLYKRG